MKRIAMLTALAMLTLTVGCSSWEKTTYQTLSATQATINQAQTDYNAKAIPQTQAAHDTITKAAQAHNAAVDLMVTYEEAKAAGGTTASLTAAQNDVTIALANLPALITDVKALYQGVK
jgi:hypothetical protein